MASPRKSLVTSVGCVRNGECPEIRVKIVWSVKFKIGRIKVSGQFFRGIAGNLQFASPDQMGVTLPKNPTFIYP
jgi:hypothetical protein